MLLQKLISYPAGFLSLLSWTDTRHCKVYPSDTQWPNKTTWQSLNTTVCGRLTVPQAMGAVCHTGKSFDNSTCSLISSQWHNTSWVAENPWLANYNDVSCPLESNLPCTTAGYPAYVIEAIDEKDVQAGINFARTHNLRLIVKGTGHDFLGRSSGAGSLSIWTHRIQGIQVTIDDPTAVKYGGVASVKISAGMRWGEVYREMARQNLTVVGGADPNVGVGGWILNGGHSPASAVYGMGADQVLSLDVVTADGEYLTVNETNHPDLFWALRGGGGSTFAVMVSVTVKAYPQLSGFMHTYAYITKAGSDTFDSLVAYFHTHIPRINEQGGMGYHFLIPGKSTGNPSLADSSLWVGIWEFPTKTEAHVNETMSPLVDGIMTADWAKEPIVITSNTTYFPSHSVHWANNVAEAAGFSGRLGSWLLDREALTSDFEELKKSLKIAVSPPSNLITHVIGGPALRDVRRNIPGGSNAVLPAWWDTYAHLVLPLVWSPENQTQKAIQTNIMRNSIIPALKKLAPTSGAYINECDPTNLDWKNDYFGANYERLLRVKHEYDPEAVFWCKPCVGWDEWEIRDGPADEDVVEWGVGPGSGSLCRRKNCAGFGHMLSDAVETIRRFAYSDLLSGWL